MNPGQFGHHSVSEGSDFSVLTFFSTNSDAFLTHSPACARFLLRRMMTWRYHRQSSHLVGSGKTDYCRKKMSIVTEVVVV